VLSAYFILAANAWMQHPVGYTMNVEKGRAELTSIVEVLTQQTALATFAHTLTLAAFTSGAFLVGVSGYLLAKKRHEEVLLPTLKLGLVTVLVSFLLVGVSGDWSARVMTAQQPMKMAAAEALYDTTSSAPFSLLTIGTLDGSKSIFEIGVPNFLSFMSTGSFNGTVEGVLCIDDTWANTSPWNCSNCKMVRTCNDLDAILATTCKFFWLDIYRNCTPALGGIWIN